MFENYPTEEELKTIREWHFTGGKIEEYHALMEYVREHWAYADAGYFDKETVGDEGIYRLHTAGWSGNESIIGAMRDNFVFWALYWYESRRGGHYIFKPVGHPPKV